jgi:hypothetical protein
MTTPDKPDVPEDRRSVTGFFRKLTADAKFTAIVGLIGAVLGAIATLTAASASGAGGCVNSVSTINQSGGSK